MCENDEVGNEWSPHSLVLVERLHKRVQLANTSAALRVPLGLPGAAGGSVWLSARLELCPGRAQVSVLSFSNVGMEGNRSLQLLFHKCSHVREAYGYAGACEDTRTILTWEQSLKTLM